MAAQIGCTTGSKVYVPLFRSGLFDLIPGVSKSHLQPHSPGRGRSGGPGAPDVGVGEDKGKGVGDGVDEGGGGTTAAGPGSDVTTVASTLKPPACIPVSSKACE